MSDERCPHGLAEVDPVTGAGCGACLIERAEAEEDAEYERRLIEAAEHRMKLHVVGQRGGRIYFYNDRVEIPEYLIVEDSDGVYVWQTEKTPAEARAEVIRNLEALAAWASNEAAKRRAKA